MKKIVIIGAGPAGLTAGYEFLKLNKGYEVVILEATAAIGGIARTIAHQGNRMDIGGHRFFSKDPRVNAWWREIMPLQGKPSLDDRLLGREMTLPTNGPDPDREDRVMLKRRRVSRIFYLNRFFDYPISMSMQTIRNLGFWRTLRAGFSYLWASVFKRKETSLENFYVNRFGKVLYGMFFEDYTTKIWGRHPRTFPPTGALSGSRVYRSSLSLKISSGRRRDRWKPRSSPNSSIRNTVPAISGKRSQMTSAPWAARSS